jgi:hypothetical protein
MDIKLRQLFGTLFMVVALGMAIYLVTSSVSETFVDTGRCGVGLPSCSGERIRCINGYCKSDIAPKLPEQSDLPLTPPTKY